MLKPTIVLAVICLVAAALLAGTYQFTKPMIEEINARMAAEAKVIAILLSFLINTRSFNCT